MTRQSLVAALPRQAQRALSTLAAVSALSAALLFNPASSKASTLAFSAHGAGPFDVRYIGGTLLEETQTLAFDTFLPFPLSAGLYQDHLDFTVVNPDGSPKFPDAVVYSSFTLSDGAGNSLSGVYTVESSDFTDPVDPFSGDIVGAQDFGGHFTFTGGAGLYSGASGGGSYTGHGDFLAFDPAEHPGALLFGHGEYTAKGSVNFVPEPATWALMLIGFGGLGVAIRQRRANGLTNPPPFKSAARATHSARRARQGVAP